ncbi:MAG: hypothetical protein HGN29_08760 [Asgard group archaeon]|nr:hypothetical protein [Asgard group archaeon]
MSSEVNLQTKEKVIIETKMPGWLRFYNIGFGLILFAGAFVILLFPEIQPYTVIAFATLIVIIGVSRLINGLFDKGLKVSTKVFKITIGFILTGLGIVTYFAPDFGEDFFIIFVSSALILNALTRMAIVAIRKRLPDAVKVLLLLLALFMFAISIIILLVLLTGILSVLTDDLLIGLLGLTVQFSGIGRLISGVSGFRLTTTKTEEEYQKQQRTKKEKKKQAKLEKELRKEKRKAKK